MSAIQEQSLGQRHIAACMKTDELYPGRTLLDVCLAAHQSITGSGDDLGIPLSQATHAVLLLRLSAWRPSVTPSSEMFDSAVRGLVQATVAELGAHLNRSPSTEREKA